MLKSTFMVLLNVIIIFSLCFSVSVKSCDTTIWVDGEKVKFNETSVIIDDDLIYVPLRVFFEALGFDEFYWDQESKTAAAFNDKTGIALQEGNNIANKNNRVVDLNQSPKIIDGYFMVPLQAVVTEVFNYKYSVIDKANLILISSAEEQVFTEEYNQIMRKKLIGNWSANIYSSGDIVDQYGSYKGTSSSVELYSFKEDGTYRYVIGGAGPVISGIVISKGEYRIEGNYIIFYHNRHTWIPDPTRNDQTPAYKDKPAEVDISEFYLKSNEKLVIDKVSYFHKIKDE